MDCLSAVHSYIFRPIDWLAFGLGLYTNPCWYRTDNIQSTYLRLLPPDVLKMIILHVRVESGDVMCLNCSCLMLNILQRDTELMYGLYYIIIKCNLCAAIMVCGLKFNDGFIVNMNL